MRVIPDIKLVNQGEKNSILFEQNGVAIVLACLPRDAA
jgi:hypothetical protein